MRTLPALVLALLFAGPLAGCIGGTSSNTAAPADDAPDVVTDPANYTYVDNASFETGGHVHDYWGGKDELTVLDRTERFGQMSIMCCDGEAERVGVLRPPAGNVIPQGTDQVRVTVDWEHRYGGSVYENPQLRVRTAADAEYHHVADVQNGDTVTITSANDENDLPHRQLSGWAFGLYVEPRADVLLWHQADVTMTVVAERGLDLPVFPAHPDRWDGREEIALLDEAHGIFVWDDNNPIYGTACIGQGCSGPLDGTHRPENGTIVPPDTALVRVRLEPQTMSPTRVGLSYHAADRWNFTRLEPTETDGRARIYEIPVTTEMADGPYNEQSLWRFLPYITDPVEDGIYAGSYRITATAVRSR